MEWFIADTHFGHTNIIKYQNRPYRNTEEMNSDMIFRWNSVVKDQDIVWHLGDFALVEKNRIPKIIKALNGRKRLIIGNHDKRVSTKEWKQFGFEKVYTTEVVYDKFLLSHWPIGNKGEQLNVCGHVHANTHQLPKGVLCISVELTDYTPVSLGYLEDAYFKIMGK